MSQGWVLLTGGNRGLGLGLAKKLVLSGRQVLLASRSHDKAAEAARRVGAETRRQEAVRPLQLDVVDPDSVSAAVEAVRRDYDQRICCLVNNAAVSSSEWEQAAWDAAYATNFEGPMCLVEQLFPHMAEGARVVNVSSCLGELHYLSTAYGDRVMASDTLGELRQMPFDGADAQQAAGSVPTYSVTKAMLNRATQLLAHDARLLHRGITVSVVNPGWCRTDLGGADATRSVEQGAGSIYWNVSYEPGENINGGFFIDGRPNCW